MADETRHSRALDAQIITDPDELARKESFNVIEQYRAVTEMVESFLAPERPFKLRPSHLLHLHRVALDGISAYAGNWRPAGIEIGASKHKPPGAFQVPERIEELCDYVNDKWTDKSPLHLAAYGWGSRNRFVGGPPAHRQLRSCENLAVAPTHTLNPTRHPR